MNKIVLIGNVCRDPEIATVGNTKKATFTVAVQRKFANAQGVKEADFIRCAAWKERAEFVEKFVTKGKKIALCGWLQIREYETQDGSKRYAAEVQIDELEFVAPKGETKHEAAPADLTPADDEDGLPF